MTHRDETIRICHRIACLTAIISEGALCQFGAPLDDPDFELDGAERVVFLLYIARELEKAIAPLYHCNERFDFWMMEYIKKFNVVSERAEILLGLGPVQ